MVSTALAVVAASYAVVMALSPILQLRQILRRRSSDGVHVGYLCVLLVGFALWVAYGVSRNELAIVVPNCVAFLVMACTIAVARAHR